MSTADEGIRDSLNIAQFRGMAFEFIIADDPRLHPNTMKIEAHGLERQATIMGQSVGGGAILITQINGNSIFARCELDTLAVFSLDIPGVLASLTRVLSDAGYNISNLRLNRTRRAGDVVSVVETDMPIDAQTVEALYKIDTVSTIIQIPKL